MTISLLLDGLLVALLAATLVYAVILNRRLLSLRKEKSGFEKMLANFNASTLRAEESIHRLKAVADVSSKELQQQTSLARTLRDDLAFLVDRGENLADRLEDATRKGRGQAKAATVTKIENAPSASRVVPKRTVPPQGPKSVAERELIQAMQSLR
ncbi:MAG: hypothetical protein J4G10_07160 [Alphaproteobacteria bacterium]|nr:hypothetical protein [Alphaproteobacteria bacterium]